MAARGGHRTSRSRRGLRRLAPMTRSVLPAAPGERAAVRLKRRATETGQPGGGGCLVGQDAVPAGRSETPPGTAERWERVRFAPLDPVSRLPEEEERYRPLGLPGPYLDRDPRDAGRCLGAEPRRSCPDRDPPASRGNPGHPRASAWAGRSQPLVSIYTVDRQPVV